jgi:hypothetical protein
MTSSISTLSDYPVPETIDRRPFRPLGAVSDYVAETLPADLQDVASSTKHAPILRAKIIHLVKQCLNSNALSSLCDDEAMSVARLDLMMLQQSLQYMDQEPSPFIHEAANTIAHLRSATPPVLTYEDIVLANPIPTDSRTFMTGETGRAELFFYGIHREIEVCLSVVSVQLYKALQTDAPDLQNTLGVCIPALEHIRDSMCSLHTELDPRAFGAMRPAFMPNTERKTPGPSGKFSAGFYSVDTLLIGNDERMQRFNGDKKSEAAFFPVGMQRQHYASQTTMQQADAHVKHCPTLQEKYSTNKQIVRELLQGMHTIRREHLKLFSKFVGRGAGTGGANDALVFVQVPLEIYADILRHS